MGRFKELSMDKPVSIFFWRHFYRTVLSQTKSRERARSCLAMVLRLEHKKFYGEVG